MVTVRVARGACIAKRTLIIALLILTYDHYIFIPCWRFWRFPGILTSRSFELWVVSCFALPFGISYLLEFAWRVCFFFFFRFWYFGTFAALPVWKKSPCQLGPAPRSGSSPSFLRVWYFGIVRFDWFMINFFVIFVKNSAITFQCFDRTIYLFHVSIKLLYLEIN